MNYAIKSWSFYYRNLSRSFEIWICSHPLITDTDATYITITYSKDPESHRSTTIDSWGRGGIRRSSVSLSRWFLFPRSSARTTTSRYGRHNNAWRNSGVESSLPPPCNDVTGKWNSRKPGHTHIMLAALSRDADRRETPFNSGLDAFPSSRWNRVHERSKSILQARALNLKKVSRAENGSAPFVPKIILSWQSQDHFWYLRLFYFVVILSLVNFLQNPRSSYLRNY